MPSVGVESASVDIDIRRAGEHRHISVFDAKVQSGIALSNDVKDLTVWQI
jgi:hypothetical protein